MPQPLDEKSVALTIYGVVQSLDELFEGYAYCRSYFTPGQGTLPIKPAGYYFMASEADQIQTWGYNLRQPGSNMQQALYVKPRDAVRIVVESRCTPLIGGGDTSTDIGSFRIIPWPAYDVALVAASDRNRIANPWLAFVPLEALPVIDLTTTEIYMP